MIAGITHMQPVLEQVVAVTDQVLLERAARGDHDAFRELYERHVGAMYGYLAGRVGADAAEDLASETFVEAWSARARFDPRMRSARPWLYGIATNVVARHREREERWLLGIDVLDAGSTSHVEEIGVVIDVDLVRALRRLSPRLRDVLLLTSVADLPLTDAARALGISAITARVRLHRARGIVASALEEDSHDRAR